MLGVNGGISSSPEDQLKGELLETLNRMAQARNEIRYAEQQNGKHWTPTGKAGGRASEMGGTAREDFASESKSWRAKLEQTVKEIENARQRYVQLTQSLKSKQGLLDEAQGMVRKWEQKLDALISRRDTMKEMANDYDGFHAGC